MPRWPSERRFRKRPSRAATSLASSESPRCSFEKATAGLSRASISARSVSRRPGLVGRDDDFVMAPLLQTWLMGEVGPAAAGVAAAVNISVAGLAAALGASLGGAVIAAGLGLEWVGP